MIWWPRHHQRLAEVVLIVYVHGHRHDIIAARLHLLPHMRIHMSSVNVTVGHKVDFKIAFLDQHGNPMVAPVTPDGVPVWSDTDSKVGTLTAAADGMTAEEVAIAAGTDTVSVNLAVGGKSFSASIDVVVAPEAQVLTSIAILSTVS